MAEKPQYGQVFSLEETTLRANIQTEKSNIRYVETPYHGNVLLMDGEIQFSTQDEYRYHEMLVHPVMRSMAHSKMNVLILGGGDGFAAREVFKWVNVGSVTVVDWDKQFVFEFGMGLLSSYNKNVYTRHNCLYEHDDALNYLIKTPHKYDVIIIDFPDPDSQHMIELYSTVIRYTKKVLAPHGAIRMHVGPASLNPSHPNWKTIGMLKDTLLHTFSGYVDFGSVYVPSFSNEWAFLQMNRQVKNLFGDPKYVENQCKLWRTDREPKSVDIQTIYATV